MTGPCVRYVVSRIAPYANLSHGEPFALCLAEGNCANNVWIDAKTGSATRLGRVSVRGQAGEPRPFAPPLRTTDWVLILRAE